MNQDPVKVNQVEWTSILPSLHLAKALRFGYRARTLVPAFAAVVLVKLLLSPIVQNFLDADFRPLDLILRGGHPIQVLASTSWRMMNPADASVFSLLTICIMVQIIAFAFGVGISRAATSEFCVQERSGALRNLKLTARRSLAAVKIAIAFLAFGCIAFIPVLLVRVFAWVTGPTEFLTTVWPALSLLAIPAILVWVVIMISGPLAAAAIATDDCGPADAVSRAINYVLSHKLRVVFLVSASITLARVAGGLAELLISLSIGVAGSDLPEAVTQLKQTLWGGARSGSPAVTMMVSLITTAVEFAVLQSALAIGYVLLRRQEDSIPYREFSRID